MSMIVDDSWGWGVGMSTQTISDYRAQFDRGFLYRSNWNLEGLVFFFFFFGGGGGGVEKPENRVKTPGASSML